MRLLKSPDRRGIAERREGAGAELIRIQRFGFGAVGNRSDKTRPPGGNRQFKHPLGKGEGEFTKLVKRQVVRISPAWEFVLPNGTPIVNEECAGLPGCHVGIIIDDLGDFDLARFNDEVFGRPIV